MTRWELVIVALLGLLTAAYMALAFVVVEPAQAAPECVQLEDVRRSMEDLQRVRVELEQHTALLRQIAARERRTP